MEVWSDARVWRTIGVVMIVALVASVALGVSAATEGKKVQPTPESLAQGEALYAGKCAVCHGENSCQACHQTDMPHPDDWTMKQHRKVASFKKDSFCFKCHDLKYCKDCHEDAG